MEELINYIIKYGLPVLVIASCIIAIIGVLKLCKVFNKISNKNIAKFVYYALDFVLAFGGVAIYFAIFKIDFGGYIMFSLTQVGATTTLYAIYENFGFRKIVKGIIEMIANTIKNNPESQLTISLAKLGLTKDAISKIEELTKSELEKLNIGKENLAESEDDGL